MPGRIKHTAVIKTGHHNYTGMTDAATVHDARYVRIEVPELPWLGYIEVSIDPEWVKIDVYPSDDEGKGAVPTLVRYHDGTFKLTG